VFILPKSIPNCPNLLLFSKRTEAKNCSKDTELVRIECEGRNWTRTNDLFLVREIEGLSNTSNPCILGVISLLYPHIWGFTCPSYPLYPCCSTGSAPDLHPLVLSKHEEGVVNHTLSSILIDVLGDLPLVEVSTA
jgi:hypothetical protein